MSGCLYIIYIFIIKINIIYTYLLLLDFIIKKKLIKVTIKFIVN